MNSKGKNMEDLLKDYINPENIEKAPEGFTSKVMSLIQVEPVPVKIPARIQNKNMIPLISCAVTIILIATAFLLPENKADSMTLPAMEVLKNLKFAMPKIDIGNIFSLNLPGTLIYVFSGLLILSLFDRALNVVFHREKQE
jgi:hypothetical protein